nr:hypothetical protein [uncultured Desulfobulbus sp.]
MVRIQTAFRILLLVLVFGLFVGPLVRAELRAPTGERDLILLIARYNPTLYRLVGQQPVPFGTAQFYSPQAIVADIRGQCFYILDAPKLVTETFKIWRVESNGAARVIFQAHGMRHGGPFFKPSSLTMDRKGQLLIADPETGLWQLGTDGQLRCLCDGKNRPLKRIGAVADTSKGLLIATHFIDDVTGGIITSAPPDWRTGVGDTLGRQEPVHIRKNQGGLYLAPPSIPVPLAQTVLVNRKPGGAEYATYWRTIRQMLVDNAGRCLLVDAGSRSKRSEQVYIWPSSNPSKKQDHAHKRTTETVINGGVFVLHPNGVFEELTFKTPDAGSGPLRRPQGIAQWSDDTYLVADPEMDVKGVSGSGGLLLLKIDGSRQARWPFGQRLRPVGVAVLRDAGPAVQAAPTRQINLAEVAGAHRAGRITRITGVSWQRQGQTGGIMGPKWDEQPRGLAEQRLRALFENAQWFIRPDGGVLFAAAGVAPQTQGTPLVMPGKMTPLEGMLSVSGNYKTQGMFDLQLGSLDARLYSAAPGAVVLDMKITIFSKTERLKATFEQPLVLNN